MDEQLMARLSHCKEGNDTCNDLSLDAGLLLNGIKAQKLEEFFHFFLLFYGGEHRN